MKFLINIINSKNKFCVNFTIRFKYIGLLFLLVTLTCFTPSRAMQENKEQIISKAISQENANKMLFDADTPEAVELALKEGAYINARNKDDDTPLHSACMRGLKEVALILIDKGTDINARNIYGRTPLHRCHSIKIVLKLIENGADFNAIDNYGNTPLHFACYNSRTEIALILIDNGANVNAVNYKDGYTPLHFACREGLKEVALKLIDKEANVNARDNDGNTPLHSIGLYRLTEVLLKLIDKEANVNAVNYKNGHTPLQLACFGNHKEAVLILIENGANPDFKHESYTSDQEIRAMLSLVSQFIKIQEKLNRNKFIEEKTKSGENKQNIEFWNNVERSNIKLGRIKPEPYKLLQKTEKNKPDTNVICELEKLGNNGNEENE